LIGFNNAMHNTKQQQTTDRQTTDNRRQAGREIQTAGRQAGRTAGKKPKSLWQKFELHTPHPKFKPFSPRELFRGMGGLPKNSVYLTKNKYAYRNEDN
jgi:site-specific DNA-cytosine methylase